jgi:predicted GNAT superfamily acetyltransferase
MNLNYNYNLNYATDCYELAQSFSLILGKGSEQEGFLQGSETLDIYQRFFTEGETMVIMDSDKLIGFIVGIKHESKLFFDTVHEEFKKIISNEQLVNSIYISKVVLAKDFHGKGIARQAYKDYLKKHSNKFIFAQIAEEPKSNNPSINLHINLGFQRSGEIISNQYNNNKVFGVYSLNNYFSVEKSRMTFSH